MAVQNRRDFLKSTAFIGASVAGLSAKKVHAGIKESTPDDRMGVLVDTTVCVGCRSCEWTCKEAHSLETGPLQSYQKDLTYISEKAMDKRLENVFDFLIKDIDYSTLEIHSLETLKSFEFRNKLNLTFVIENTVSEQFNRTLRQEQKVDSILNNYLN